MNQLKQLIISRIQDLKHLQSSKNDSIDSRYQCIMKQRNGQQLRNKKQTFILSTAHCIGFNQKQQELHSIVMQICKAYDPNIGHKIQKQDKITDYIYNTLKFFFHKYGYKQKLDYLKSLFTRTYSVFLPCLILALLSEWSKKKYMHFLNLQLKTIKSRYLENQLKSSQFSPIPKQLLVQNAENIHNSQKYSKKYSNQDNISDSLDNDKLQVSLKLKAESNLANLHKNNYYQLSLSAQQVSIGNNNLSKLLTIYNRPTLYGYIVDELNQLYELTGMNELDYNYVRILPKRKMKNNLIYSQNINRAVQVLIQCSNNKQIRNQIRQYNELYKLHIIQSKKNTRKKGKNAQNKSSRSMSDYILKNEAKVNCQDKKMSIVSNVDLYGNGKKQQKKQIQTQITKQSINQKNEQSYLRLKQRLKYELISKNKHVRFPTLNSSVQKSSDKSELMIPKSNLFRFQTEQNNQYSSSKQKSRVACFKICQRQTIKGIIAKNFLSNRQKQNQNQNKLHIDQNNILTNTKQTRKKISSREEEDSKKMVIKQCIDIRSLRQKTNALLKNFKIVQNY